MTTAPTVDKAEATAAQAEADAAAAQADAIAAKADVDRAEQEIASGSKRVTAGALHKLRDTWRHANLTAQATRQQAEEDRRAARLAGLGRIGAEVDKLAGADETVAMAEALREVAQACARFRALAKSHDEAVAELVAAATDLGAEPAAPGGPRPTSAYVAVNGKAIIYKHTRVSPLGDCTAPLAKAMEGEIDAALSEIRAAIQIRRSRRPDYLIRGGNGQLIAITGELDTAMQAQIDDPRSPTRRLSEHEIDLYMNGALR